MSDLIKRPDIPQPTKATNPAQLDARLLRLVMDGFDTNTNEQKEGFGREYVHSLYPNEIEAYACALELVDGDENTVKFFAFPVMPRSYNEQKLTKASIVESMTGVVVNTNPTFKPFDITISGTFGRMFRKVEIGIPERGNAVQTLGSVDVTPTFDNEFKTGYGCFKTLELMIQEAQSSDVNYNPHKLFFYNLTKNSNYLVQPLSFTGSMDQDSSNMLWQYQLALKAIAPARSVRSRQDIKSSLKLLTDYTYLNRNILFTAQEIQQYSKIEGKDKTPMQLVLERQLRGRAMGALSSKAQNVLTAALQLTENPRELDDFGVNNTDGILNRL